MKKLLSVMALVIAIPISCSAADNLVFTDAKYQCHRSLRAFVRETYPDHILPFKYDDMWKKVKSKDKQIINIKAKEYIKIKSRSTSDYKSHDVYCSYYKPTMTVISIGISPLKLK